MRVEVDGYWYEGPPSGVYGESEYTYPATNKGKAELIRKLFAALATTKKADETLAISILGEEEYDNSPCQAHPLELLENRVRELEQEASILREAIREALPLLDGQEFRILDHALTTARKK